MHTHLENIFYILWCQIVSHGTLFQLNIDWCVIFLFVSWWMSSAIDANGYFVIFTHFTDVCHWKTYLFLFRVLFVGLDFEFLSGVDSSLRILLVLGCAKSTGFAFASRSDDIFSELLIFLFALLTHFVDAQQSFSCWCRWNKRFCFHLSTCCYWHLCAIEQMSKRAQCFGMLLCDDLPQRHLLKSVATIFWCGEIHRSEFFELFLCKQLGFVKKYSNFST